MSAYLYANPHVLALLRDAKERPEDDVPRLVLADWLDEHGDPERAEFIRFQVRLASGAPPLSVKVHQGMRERCQRLLDRHGGAWLGPLWRWWLAPVSWHRGLLSVRLPRRAEPADVADAFPWLDTALFTVQGKTQLQRALRLLARSQANHAFLDLRLPLREDTLLEALALLPESPLLRSLSFDWPLRLIGGRRRLRERDSEPDCSPAVSMEFFARLLDLALCRHLTHLGSTPPLSRQQVRVLRAHGVQPAHARDRFWMHSLPRSHFAARRAVASCAGQ